MAESVLDLFGSPTSSAIATAGATNQSLIAIPSTATIDQPLATLGCSIYSYYASYCTSINSTSASAASSIRASCLCYVPAFSTLTYPAATTLTSYSYVPDLYDNAARACAAYIENGTALGISDYAAFPTAAAGDIDFCSIQGNVRQAASSASPASSAAVASQTSTSAQTVPTRSTSAAGKVTVGTQRTLLRLGAGVAMVAALF